MKLSEVIHLYIGQECEYKWIREPDKILHGKVTPKVIESIHYNDGILTYVKLILRPLSDATKQETKEILMSGDEIATDIELDAARTLYLLSKGFDLFGLIESGQAIDKTKITTGK